MRQRVERLRLERYCRWGRGVLAQAVIILRRIVKIEGSGVCAAKINAAGSWMRGDRHWIVIVSHAVHAPSTSGDARAIIDSRSAPVVSSSRVRATEDIARPVVDHCSRLVVACIGGSTATPQRFARKVANRG